MLRNRLADEFASRKRNNPRYSLRAFAAFLGSDHSTVSQVLHGTRRATVAQVRSWSRKLGLAPGEISVLLAAEQAPDDSSLQRQAMLRRWTAEAESVLRGPLHLQIVKLCRTPDFRPDCRWIAKQAGVSVDEVNLALQRLLRLGLIELAADGAWWDRTGLEHIGDREFKRVALARVREKAAEDRVKFGKEAKKNG